MQELFGDVVTPRARLAADGLTVEVVPGQSAIGAVTINGRRLFTPNAP